MKNSLKIIIGLISSIIVLIIYLIIKNSSNDITFYLIGNQQVFISLSENYHDLGFVATNSNNDDLSQFVTIKSYINNNQIGTYVVKYTLNYEDFTKEISRIVRVVENINDNYYMVLNGEKEEKVLLGKTYIDKGSILYDKDANPINVNIDILGNVNTELVGNYELIYKTTYNGINYQITRNIMVYDFETDYVITNENSSKKISFFVNKDYFKMVKLPDGSINSSNTFSFIVSENGLYNFEIYDIYDNKKNIQINIEDIVSDLKCSGEINRYGTAINVTGKDVDRFSSFEWNLDGIKYSGNSKYNVSYKKISNATVVVKNEVQSIDIKCDIVNNLLYEFKYDENNQKPFMKCDTYTETDRFVLEDKLKSAVLEAGYGTRAGIVEAARFLVGALDYKVPYVGPKSHDLTLGEYSKVGLNIANSKGWGCWVSGWVQGMDCTNVIHWAYVQAGVKSPGVYSSSNNYKIVDVINRIQVGDLLLTPKEGNSGFTHAGMVIGIDNDNLYVIEATTGNINATVVTKIAKNNVPKKGKFSIAKLCNYGNDGNLTNMWVS